MTTQTEPLVTGGRVKSMKTKFENLSSLESLDISGAFVKSKPFAKFQRSATSLDLFESHKSKGVNNKPIIVDADSKSNMRRQSSDTFLSKLANRSVVKTSRPLNEIKENVEQISRLTRQTSDPVKRSSIRRSPAFRVGEKPVKSVASIATKSVPEEDVPEKIDKFLKRSVNDEKCLESLQPGITDTLKAALRQPLPSGPPPKKPPRAFESPKEDINTIQLFEEKLRKEKESIDWRERIGLKSDVNKKSTAKNHSTQSNLLSCIRCTTPVYDSVVPHRKDHSTVNAKTNPTEHIYMEPFGHLKEEFVAKQQQCFVAPDIVTSSTPHLLNCDNSKSKHSISECSCPEDHNGKGGDLHYLVSGFVLFVVHS